MAQPEEAEVERFYEDLQDLLELTLKKDVLFIMGEWMDLCWQSNVSALEYAI